MVRPVLDDSAPSCVLGRTGGARGAEWGIVRCCSIFFRVSSRVELSDPEFEGELDRPWAENIVTAAAAVLTVAMLSSVAVLMYLA